jgi:hypothetical protein
LEYGQGLYPQGWMLVGSDQDAPVRAGTLGEWDTTGLDGLYALRLMVVRTDQRVEQVLLQITLDNTPPKVAITYPQDGQQVVLAEEAQLPLQAQVDDPFLAEVEFSMDGTFIGRADLAPFGVIWKAQAGTHTLQVVATDQAGNTTESIIHFTVE